MRVAVFGATGHTGQMTVAALRARGADVAPFGSKDVDVRDLAAVQRALKDMDAVVNLAGPFLATGDAPIQAAIARGIPYADSTGEQAFMRQARERYHNDARKAGVAVVNALAFEYALGDLAAFAYVPEGADALHVLYRYGGSQGSIGTKRSVLRVLAGPALGYENGALVKERSAQHRRSFHGRTAISFPGGEILTVPRHTPFKTVRTYVPTRQPGRARLAGLLAPVLLRGPVLAFAEGRVKATHEPPRNDDAKAEVRLVSVGPDREVSVQMGDPYFLTAEILAEGIVRLAKPRALGVVSPAEALDAPGVFAALSRRVPEFKVTTDERRK